MAYKLDKYGDQVKDDLDKVENKDIYPDASPTQKGLMTAEHVNRITECEQGIQEAEETLTEFEIMIICR